MKEKIRVLFICIHNSGRSQMAEAFLKTIGGGRFEVESAGLEPKPINPYVIKVMKEIGYDLSGNTSDRVMQFFKEGRLYDYVITVCNEFIENQNCLKRIIWFFQNKPVALHPDASSASKALTCFCLLVGRSLSED